MMNPISAYSATGSYGMYGSLGRNNIPGASEDTADKAQRLPGSKPMDKLPGMPGGEEDEEKKTGRKSSPSECETCKNRKYQDGSDEMVSFKSAAHIAPQASAAAVMGHEQEHVSNAYKKAATGNGKVINASVSLHTSICPECGRSYVSGGTTNTQIKYYNEENPYQQSLKSADRTKYQGMNVDLAV